LKPTNPGLTYSKTSRTSDISFLRKAADNFMEKNKKMHKKVAEKQIIIIVDIPE
jgi:hypothetical protein